jgi:hypothetical protein
MSLLSDDEIDVCWNGPMPCGYGKSRYNIAKALQAAILAKLASAELPSDAWDAFVKNECSAPEFTADQLRQAFAQGAASQLAQEPSAYLWAPRKKPELAKLAFQPEPSIQLKALGYLSQPLFTRKEPK